MISATRSRLYPHGILQGDAQLAYDRLNCDRRGKWCGSNRIIIPELYIHGSKFSKFKVNLLI